MKDWKEIVQKIGELESKKRETLAKLAYRVVGNYLRVRRSKKKEAPTELGEKLYGLMKKEKDPVLFKVVGEDLFKDLQEIETEIHALQEILQEILKKGKEAK